MRLTAGQAARHTVRHCGRFLHALARLAMLLALLAGTGFAFAAWRLAQGPVNLPWLIPRLEAAVNRGSTTHLSIGAAALAWEGFSHGAAGSLDIRLSNVRVTDAIGRRLLAVPHAALSLAAGALVRGRPVPRSLEVDGARLRATRSVSGQVSMDLGELGSLATTGAESDEPEAGFDIKAMVQALAAPPGPAATSVSPWSQLRRVRIRDAAFTVLDRHLGVVWSIPSADLDLRRGAKGGIDASATATIAVKGVSATLDLHATVDPDAAGTLITGKLGPIAPAALAGVLPQAAAAHALDAPVTLTGAVRLNGQFDLADFTAEADIAPGTLHLGTGTAPILDARIDVQGTPDRLEIPLLTLVTTPGGGRPLSTFTGHAALTRSAGGATGSISLDLDHVDFADLPVLWPTGVGGHGTRPWIVQNIVAGTAHDGHLDIAFSAPPDFSTAQVTHVAGGIDGSDLTVHWLRPVPPIVHGQARLNFLTADSVEVIAHGGTVSPGAGGDITLRGGRAVFTGFSDPDQFADIVADLAGPVPAAFSLLGNPKIGLLQKSPLRVANAAGSFAGTFGITHMNMKDSISLDDLQIATTLKLADVALPKIAAGRDLTNGSFDLHADNAGMRAQGAAALAGIPVQLVADMDFRSGPPSQVLEHLVLSGTIDDAQRAALGIDLSGLLRGPLPTKAEVSVRRNQHGEATLGADLTQASLVLDPLAYTKPAGEAAQLSARVLLDHDRITALDGVRADGATIHVAGAAAFANGKPASVTLQRLVLGPAGAARTDAAGTVRLPEAPGQPYVADLHGQSLDASAPLKRRPPTPQNAKPAAPAKPGPPYVVDARFGRVWLGPDRSFGAVAAHVDNDGQIMRRLTVSGRTQANQPFTLAIAPSPGGRTLTARTDDAGGLLRALDVLPDMYGGRLTLDGSYDDTRPDHRLSGRAEIDDFSIRHAPLIAKLLQAMTLYGLVEAMQGPGLGFSKLLAPFTLADDRLGLGDSRMFNASLGMTARGEIDLRRQTVDLQGTIVPAYFFNSLLGKLPLVGRMFSPEPGSGLFAATYTARGPLGDPSVGVNPLAALTPGFLRGVFGLFDQTDNNPPPSVGDRRSPAH